MVLVELVAGSDVVDPGQMVVGQMVGRRVRVGQDQLA